MKIVFREHVAFHPDFQHRSPSGRLIFDFAFALARARNLFQHFFHFGAESLQHIIIVSENLYRDVGANAFEHFVKAHLDRLRDHHASTGI